MNKLGAQPTCLGVDRKTSGLHQRGLPSAIGKVGGEAPRLSRTAPKSDAKEHFEDAYGGFERRLPIPGDFADASDAAAVIDRDFADAEMVLGGLDLHLEVPAVGELGHVELLERGAADGAEGTHVGVADALEEAQEEADEVAGEDLAGEHGAGLATAADARAEDEVGLVVGDGLDERGQAGDEVGPVAIHVDEDVGGGVGGERAGEAGGAIAAGGLDDAGSGGAGDLGGAVGRAVVDDEALAEEGPGHLRDDVADGLGFVEGGDDDGDLRHELIVS